MLRLRVQLKSAKICRKVGLIVVRRTVSRLIKEVEQKLRLRVKNLNVYLQVECRLRRLQTDYASNDVEKGDGYDNNEFTNTKI